MNNVHILRMEGREIERHWHDKQADVTVRGHWRRLFIDGRTYIYWRRLRVPSLAWVMFS